MNDDLKLLVEWSSPWEEFLTAIRPALSRSAEPLDAEAHTGLFPYRGMLIALALEIALLFVAIVLPAKLASMRAFHPPPRPTYDVIYFSGNELPQMQDAGGAKSGRSGRSGGREGHHATQVIRVARGPSLQEQVVDAPKLNLPHSDSAVANLLAYKSVPGPPPAQGLNPSSRRAEMPVSPVPPPADVQRQNPHAAPVLEASVIAPAPSALQKELTSRRAPGSRVDVTPPPVSAPREITNLHPLLTLPPSIVIPPAPDQIEHQIGSVNTRAGVQELQKQIVPPPEQAGNTLGDRRAVNSLGNSPVVAPPAESANISAGRRQTKSLGDARVVPPPAQVNGLTHQAANGLGNASVVPPPAQLNGSLMHQAANTLSPGNAVVPPPPSDASSNSVSGRGRRGPANSMSDAVAPPSNDAGTGIVLSNKPGSKVGSPGTASPGSLALSPAGGAKPGLGGSGGGTGISHGTGPGSSTSGEGSGAKTNGTGPGSDEIAHKGISPFPGTGGAGKGSSGPPPMPGVSVSGGSNNNIVTLPSFGSDAKAPSDPAHSPKLKNQGPGITVVATSRSGGAFNFYGALKGDKVYTIYIDTAMGTAVMQFADPKSATQPYPEDLTAPLAIRADLPANLHSSRLVIACTLDRDGMINNPRVLEGGSTELSAEILAALPRWKFRPAFRGDQPIEVNAILGFDIDTR